MSQLRLRRKRAKLSIEALAHKAKLSASIVRLAERWPTTMSERTGRRCARALGCSVEELRDPADRSEEAA